MPRLSDEERRVRQTVGSRIRELRKSMGLTTTTLAGKAGISQSQLSKLENGKATISIPTLTKLCLIFDRPLSYLFQKDEEVPRVLGTMTTVPGPENRGLAWFAKEVKRRSHGRMSLISLWATVLGSAPEQVRMLQEGIIDLFIEELIFYQHIAPTVNFVSLPYVFANDVHLLAFLESTFFEETVRRPLMEEGIRILNRRWNWRRGLERVLISKQPVTRPEEVKGKRVRIFDSPALARFWEGFGAHPVVVHWPRVKEAWAKGEFDLLPTHRSHLYPLGFCRHGHYVTRLGDVPPALAVTVNAKKYLSLPPDIQDALEEACDAAGTFFTQEIQRSEPVHESKNLSKYGAVYLKVDLSPWRQASSKVVKDMAKSGEIDRETLKIIQHLTQTKKDITL